MKSYFYLSLLAAAGLATTTHAQESFEEAKQGNFTKTATMYGELTAAPDNAAIHGKGRSGKQGLHIKGGENKTVELALAEIPKEDTGMELWAERWTGANPFAFRIEAIGKNGTKIIAENNSISVGGYKTNIKATIPAGTEKLRFVSTAAPKGGVLLDDLLLIPNTPMKVGIVSFKHPGIYPVMQRKEYNPVLGVNIPALGVKEAKHLTGVTINFNADPKDIESVTLYSGTSDATHIGTAVFTPAKPDKASGPLTFTGDMPLKSGNNWIWVSVKLSKEANLDHTLTASAGSVLIDGKPAPQNRMAVQSTQNFGYEVAQPGDLKSKGYRIPGMIRTKDGTLIASFDARYRHHGDLAADIDVAVARSTDGGQTWTDPYVAMDTGNDPKHGYDGCGDACILQDAKTGRIWLSALWYHKKGNSWGGSAPGMKPEETGQFVMVHSDDDGKTWSKEITNITPQIKDPAWRLVLPGPGMGITMKDGTLVFPAQYRGKNDETDKGKPYSTICYSKDNGKTWTYGTGIKIDTTECQVCELADGSLMLNCRDNRGGSRTVGITKDLGKTWTMHETDRKALIEPVCQASLIAVDDTPAGRCLFFSNPHTKGGRHTMSIQVSQDEGKTWSKAYTYDSRPGCGYSCLAPIDKEHIGILYETPLGINFLRIKYSDLGLGGK